MDRMTPEARSRLMSKIRGRHTGPERMVRKILHGMGLRFRLHGRDLPGTPDIVLPRWRTVVFVHGCFWHGHKGCRDAVVPKTRTDFWLAKITGNHKRDARNAKLLRKAGWRVVNVWECQTTDSAGLTRRLRRMFDRLWAPGLC